MYINESQGWQRVMTADERRWLYNDGKGRGPMPWWERVAMRHFPALYWTFTRY